MDGQAELHPEMAAVRAPPPAGVALMCALLPELLDALLSRAGEVTAYEASDVLHAVSRSARFQKLEVPRGRLLDAFARLDGPFDAIQRIYLDESAPSAWTSPPGRWRPPWSASGFHHRHHRQPWTASEPPPRR